MSGARQSNVTFDYPRLLTISTDWASVGTAKNSRRNTVHRVMASSSDHRFGSDSVNPPLIPFLWVGHNALGVTCGARSALTGSRPRYTAHAPRVRHHSNA
jgi:hypothetical protein